MKGNRIVQNSLWLCSKNPGPPRSDRRRLSQVASGEAMLALGASREKEVTDQSEITRSLLTWRLD